MPLRKPFTEFTLVGLGKGGRKFHHCVEDDQQSIELIPELNNKYDNKAICVKIENKIVGYVSRENTKTVHQFLKRRDDGDPHLLSFYLVNKYSSSARWLIIDLTLATKRNIKSISK